MSRGQSSSADTVSPPADFLLTVEKLQREMEVKIVTLIVRTLLNLLALFPSDAVLGE